jgi:hypothetical protein
MNSVTQIRTSQVKYGSGYVILLKIIAWAILIVSIYNSYKIFSNISTNNKYGELGLSVKNLQNSIAIYTIIGGIVVFIFFMVISIIADNVIEIRKKNNENKDN